MVRLVTGGRVCGAPLLYDISAGAHPQADDPITVLLQVCGLGVGGWVGGWWTGGCMHRGLQGCVHVCACTGNCGCLCT